MVITASVQHIGPEPTRDVGRMQSVTQRADHAEVSRQTGTIFALQEGDPR